MGVANAVKLLLTEESPHAAQPALPNLTSKAASSRTILVAEDDASVSEFVVLLLKERGYHVLAAENGRKALEQCTQYSGPIHALITDAVMPEMNGRELAERARQIRPDLKVLLISGYVDRGFKVDDRANPCNAFLEKPLSEERLIQVIESFCFPACAVVA